MKNNETDSKKTLTLFGFFALTASMVMTVYEYPTFATSGLHLVFFLLLGGFLWFLPVALCAAEMATVKGFQEGGIFSWVGNTLGERYGFAAIFFQWFQITVGFVTMIYFILGAFSYVLGWQVPAYPLPADLEDQIIQRIVCRADFGHNMAEEFVADFKMAITDLEKAHLRFHEQERNDAYGFTH